MSKISLGVILSILLIPSDGFAGPGAQFIDVTSQSGISASHSISDPNYFSTGQAFGDYGNDGWVDLYVTNNGGPNTLYRNQNGNFELSPYSAQVAVPEGLSGGAVWVDFDNDGWKDLYVLRLGANRLFRNLSGQGFSDVTALAGVGDTGKGQTATWGDFDNDGRLDLYVVNWECDECPQGWRDGFYRQNVDGTFTDLTAVLGQKTERPGFSASFVDYDNDGDLDLYLVNDRQTGNVLWRNDGPGCGGWCFEDVSAMTRTNTQVSGMGLALGDVDNDGDLDLYFSHAGPAVLLINRNKEGQVPFFDRSAIAAVDYDAFSWGAIMFDANNDGWQDLFLSVMSSVSLSTASNRYFENLRNGRFSDRSSASGAGFQGESMGVAYADYDNDGRLDYVIGNRNQDYRLFRNTTPLTSSNHWLTLRLIGAGAVNKDAIGTKVYLSHGYVQGPANERKGGETQLQIVTCGSSLGSGNDSRLYFGLGNSTAADLKIVWPDGIQETLTGVSADQIFEIQHP